jgi:cation diffusion facilitator CzcD-associated flavoprotein CzcO/acetyl esterase/lipase
MRQASWQARMAAWIVRRRIRPALGDLRDVARVRRVFGQPLPRPGGVRITPATVGGIAGEWVEPAGGAAQATLLYLHGGGFVACAPRTHRGLTAALARRGWRVFVPDYRLAPEHPFPAAIDDAVAAWEGLQAETAGRPAAVAGDSAGGNLAVALMLRLREAGRPLPAAAALFSPCTDLTGGSPSMVENAALDAMFDPQHMPRFAEAYLGPADPAHPLASVLHADLAGLPPLLLHASRVEALRDDSVRFADKARAAGVTVHLQLWDAVPHVWQLLWWLPEAKQSVGQASGFLLGAVREAAAGRPAVEELDVCIVGAGLSGIGAAVHLQQRLPQQRWAILEAREAIGGTWDLFRYPGIRSDSDMHTLGYAFKPWRAAEAIADGPSIRRYVRETADEHGITPRVRFGHRVLRADWSSEQARWLLELEVAGPDGPQRRRLAARFLWMCAGYYSYAGGHRPAFPGEERYRGTLVHPQQWPRELDWGGRQVVVIGSGATAVTLVPELAKAAAHVTMLQRSPTWIVARPGRDAVAQALGRVLPAMWAYRLVRTRNILLQQVFYRLARRWPQAVGRHLLAMAAKALPAGYDLRHFTPAYKPWDQRVCLVPDGDLFRAIRRGQASVATGTIETFTERGIRLHGGEEIPADIVVTATGLRLNLLGDVQLAVDGRPVDLAQALVYKGLMFSGVPNLVSTFGYTNASWTLKADLTAGWTCRLLAHMARHGWRQVVPVRTPGLTEQPFLDFSSGYVQRAVALLPKQGTRKPWRLDQNYLLDLLNLRWSRLEDGALRFSAAPAPAAAAAGTAPWSEATAADAAPPAA